MVAIRHISIPGFGHPSVQSDEPSANAAAILAAARALALDVGFRRTTVADVARRARVSRMTVYREFDDLGAIWSRLMTDELGELIGACASRIAARTNARARIVSLAEALAVELPDHPLFRRALDVDPELLLPLVVARFGSSQRAGLALLEPLIEAGREDGSIRTDLDARAGATTIVLAVQSFVFSARAIESRPDPAAVRAELAVMLDRYLAA
jgi:AcrR family transcriptional regulator